MTTETQTFSPPHLHTDWVMVPKEPTREMLEAAVRRDGGWIEPYTAPRESGVAVDGDMSREDADELNRQSCDDAALDYAAMLSAAPPPPVTTREAELEEWLAQTPAEKAEDAIEVARAKGCHLPKGDISRRILKNEVAQAVEEAVSTAIERCAKVNEEIAGVVCERVASLSDRTSPDWWPEAMLVTAKELHLIVSSQVDEAIRSLAPGGKDAG